jgi:hypothetical protein
MGMGTEHVYWAKLRCTNLFCEKKSYVTVDDDGSPIFNNYLQKLFGGWFCQQSRPLYDSPPEFPYVFKLLPSRHTFYPYISIFKKGIVETVLGKKPMFTVYTQGTCLIHFVFCASRKFAASHRTIAMEMLALIILFRQVWAS